MVGVFLKEKLLIAPLELNLETFEIFILSSCRAELIGFLFVEMG
jgi:hypothetical protein